MLGNKVHTACGRIRRYQFGHCILSRPPSKPSKYPPELAMQKAIQDPINQHQTAVAGPPAMMGLPKVAGTDPKTPRIEMAYETVDHWVNSLRNSCLAISLSLMML